jgi:ubiquinol-cytochrome c reductase cytochrome c subunit
MHRLIVRSALAAAVAGAFLGFGFAPASAAGDAANGKLQFVKHGCWQCHGFNGQGSVASSGGKVLAPDPLPWEAFSAFVRSTNRAMPPFSEKILPDSDLADIYAYLQSVPKTADYKTIPLLNQ